MKIITGGTQRRMTQLLSGIMGCSSIFNSTFSIHLLFLLLITTSFFTSVGGKFGVPPPSTLATIDQQHQNPNQQNVHQLQQQQQQLHQNEHNSLVLLNLSGPQPSDKFIPCHFNPGCFCKYDQKTEIYDSLRRLWQLVGFNETSFFRAVNALQREIRNDPQTTYFFPESDLSQLAQMVVNSSSATLHSFGTYANSHYYTRSMEPGPIFEFVCLAVPMAVIPTEYSAHGVISHVSVTGSELGILDGSAFAGLEIQNIQLSRDHLYFISEYAFSSMGNSLTVLDLSANFLDEIPFAAFKALKVLEWLNLNNNLLHSLSGDWFFVTESLRQLSVSGNSVDSIPFKLLPNFNRLVWLDLSSNFIRNVSHEQLPPNIQTLILMKNRFQHFPAGVFHLKSLSWLILSGCTIDRIPTDWPNGVAPLQMNQLDLTENFIQNWPRRPFSAQLTVLDLDISKNYIQVLPAGAFHSMNCFRLSLGYNRINMIDPDAFYTLESTLQYLNLENNAMPGIPWHAMYNLSSLMHLYVGANQLTDDTVGAPDPGLGCKLTYLGLNGNHLTKVPRRLLSRCSNLLHLNLGYNQIAHLDDLAILTAPVRTPSFAGGAMIIQPSKRLRNLSTLVLRNNPIYSLAYSGTGSHSSQNLHNNHNNNDNGHSPQQQEGSATNKNSNNLNSNNNNGNSEGMGILVESSVEAYTKSPYHSSSAYASGSYHVLPPIPNVFRAEAFPNLYELSLSFCQLSGEIEPFPSLPLTNLEISMGLKSATTVRPAMFQALRNLEWLALDHNSLQSVSDYSFYSNRNLTYVNLEWNKIEILPRQMFHPDIHQSISQVRLSHNKIQSIASESFLSFPAINLDLSYNAIQSVERQAFSIAVPGQGGQPIPAGVLGGAPGINLATSGGGGGGARGGNAAILALENELTSMSPNEVGYFSAPSTSSAYLGGSGAGGGGGVNPSSPSSISATLANRPGLNLYLNQNKLTLTKPNSLAGDKFSLVDLSYNQLVSFNFDTFARRTLLGGLNLSHNSIERVTVPRNRRIVLKFLDLSHNRIQYRTGSGALTNACPSVFLDMSNNKLERIDSKLFPTNCSLREIRLESNYITSLDPESFTNLRDLTVLQLASNQISFVPEILFIRNSKLNYLDLSRNRIRSLPRDALVGSSIENLKLSTNQFVNVPVGALSQVSRRLRRLDMSYNSVEHLDSTMFEPIAGLVHLNLSNNRLTILPDNAFSNLASLRELDLSNNNIRANFKELFHFLPKLKLLRLSNCGVKALPYLPLPHLVSLDLSANRMEEIRQQSLSSLTRLRVLDLSDNELSSSRIPSWTPLANLVTLKISNNPLKSLTKDTFYGLNRLETLEILDMGRLDRFDSDVLSHLVNLRSLAVETYPNIEKYRFRLGAVLSGIAHLEELRVQIKEQVLSDQLLGGILPKLRKLTIFGAGLKKLEPSAFEGLQNCFHMDLSIQGTGVDDIPPRLFELLQHAEWARLDISNNKMSYLDSSALYPNRSIWFSKGTKLLQGGLILDGNEWICDCDLVWIGEWLRRWLRESFESHSTAIPLVHAMYEEIRRPNCLDIKGGGKIIPLIELYSDVMCHASALSKGSTLSDDIAKMLRTIGDRRRSGVKMMSAFSDILEAVGALLKISTPLLLSSLLPIILFTSFSSISISGLLFNNNDKEEKKKVSR